MTKTTFQQACEAYIEAHAQKRHYSGAVLVAKGSGRDDQEVLFSKAYGLANREWDVPNTIDTKFRIGSVTKQFTAAAVLRLVEQGKLDLDAPMSTYLSSPVFPADKGDILTAFLLLTHQSGLPNCTDLPEYESAIARKLHAAPVDTLAYFKDLPFEFEPGTKVAYSNSNYQVLTVLIETVSGEGWVDVLRKEVLEPLGLNDTGVEVSSKLLKHRASGYELEDGKIQNASYVDMGFPLGAGAMYSTVGDLHRWTVALAEPGRLLSQKSLDRMYNVPAVFPDPKNENTWWGCGLMCEMDATGLRRIEHGGSINGFVSKVGRIELANTSTANEETSDDASSTGIQDSLIVIVLANNGGCGVGDIYSTLPKLYAGEEVAPPEDLIRLGSISPDVLASLAGEYANAAKGIAIEFEPAKDDKGRDVLDAFIIDAKGKRAEKKMVFAPQDEEVWYQIDAPALVFTFQREDGKVVRTSTKSGTVLKRKAVKPSE